ncbi:hypothetical protein BN6_45600 [Saccharothrix espanaensis DSM 44229]|uniref:Uncharacterized protein n=1 Tax=Saccharothrix espanaensis (strain ATCC 51144 / DSM 44229 / JCM 9112 / NBRC 15066 / NRRL 15764) TaxID=1179773 RepID=K0JVE7_SACES|nr:hypothetical protein BN6_45600 [Saccharothrix espanaensis DSM 44229]
MLSCKHSEELIPAYSAPADANRLRSRRPPTSAELLRRAARALDLVDTADPLHHATSASTCSPVPMPIIKYARC